MAQEIKEAEKRCVRTVADIARELNVDDQSIYKCVDAGLLPCLRIGRHIRITNEQFDSFLQTLTAMPRAWSLKALIQAQKAEVAAASANQIGD